MKTQRRLRNVLLDQKFQLPFALTVSVLPLLALCFCLLYLLYFLTIALDTAGIYACIDSISAINLKGQISKTMLGAFAMIFLLSGFVFYSALRTSHRIVGPLVPIMRHLRELKEGRFESRVTLRQSDYLQDLAAELNELAAQLEKKSGKS